MPKELITPAPREIGYQHYDDRDPVADEALIETTVSGIKHGTELNIYRGTLPFASELFDPVLRLFRAPRHDETIAPFFPHTMGSWAAGIVRKVGPNVRRFHPGDMVHGEWKHRQTAIKREGSLYPVIAPADGETMIFSDPARFALAAVHDAAIKLGDRVAVFGMGAIGLLAVQMARLNGAVQIVVVDPIAGRRALALPLGADMALDPAACDAGMTIKEATGGEGVDVALEISGVYSALQHAIRAVHREGLVVTASYYGDTAGRVDLSREWHHNRITLRSSMPVWDCSHRCQPMWDLQRVEETAVQLLAQGRISVKPLIGARIPFSRAAEAYKIVDQSPDAAVKVILTYSAAGEVR
jgi:threonine dehydrogenase-like Zn-dependent dehydrogenase